MTAGRPALPGVTADMPYGVSDVARCGRVTSHVPPHPGCRCGFYAWRHRASATSLLWGSRPALLEVELLGRFDEYELGHVAAAQIVRRVHMLRVCAGCLDAGQRPPQQLAVLNAFYCQRCGHSAGAGWVKPETCRRRRLMYSSRSSSAMRRARPSLTEGSSPLPSSS